MTKTNTATMIAVAEAEYCLPVGVEDPNAEFDTRLEAQQKGFKYVIGNEDGPSIGVREDGSLHDTSCGAFREAEGLEFLRAQAQQIVTRFGEGPVKCRGKVIPDSSKPIWQASVFEEKTGYLRQLVSPETPIGGGDNNGWYRVIEMEFASLEEMAKNISSWGSDSEAATSETLKLAELQIAVAVCYR